jgi:hypothetical protein
MPAIATVTLEARDAAGNEFPVTIEIGAPRQIGDEEWHCAWSVEPLPNQSASAHGVDSFQALCLAIRSVQYALQYFKEDGGTLLMDGGDFPFEAYACGPWGAP